MEQQDGESDELKGFESSIRRLRPSLRDTQMGSISQSNSKTFDNGRRRFTLLRTAQSQFMGMEDSCYGNPIFESTRLSMTQNRGFSTSTRTNVSKRSPSVLMMSASPPPRKSQKRAAGRLSIPQKRMKKSLCSNDDNDSEVEENTVIHTAGAETVDNVQPALDTESSPKINTDSEKRQEDIPTETSEHNSSSENAQDSDKQQCSDQLSHVNHKNSINVEAQPTGGDTYIERIDAVQASTREHQKEDVERRSDIDDQNIVHQESERTSSYEHDAMKSNDERTNVDRSMSSRNMMVCKLEKEAEIHLKKVDIVRLDAEIRRSNYLLARVEKMLEKRGVLADIFNQSNDEIYQSRHETIVRCITGLLNR